MLQLARHSARLHRMALYLSPAPSVLVPSSSSPLSCAAAILVVLCVSVSIPVVVLWWPCGGCPHSHLPHQSSSPIWSSLLPLLSVPLLSMSGSSCPIYFVIVAPPPFHCCALPIFAMPIARFHPPHSQVLVAVAWEWVCYLGAVSW
jgi:hypothetical protein